jgi:hypothetical protein
MKILIRKRENDGFNGDLFEWSPMGSGRWYSISRFRMRGLYPQGDGELTRNLFNALFQGLTCVVKARYFRNQKVLQIETIGVENRGKEKEKESGQNSKGL